MLPIEGRKSVALETLCGHNYGIIMASIYFQGSFVWMWLFNKFLFSSARSKIPMYLLLLLRSKNGHFEWCNWASRLFGLVLVEKISNCGHPYVVNQWNDIGNITIQLLQSCLDGCLFNSSIPLMYFSFCCCFFFFQHERQGSVSGHFMLKLVLIWQC